MGVPRQYHKCIAIIMNNLFVVPIILSMGYFVNTRVLLLETKNDGTYKPNKGNDYETGNDYNDDVIVVPEGGRTTTTPTTVLEGGQMTTTPTPVPEGGRTTTTPTTMPEGGQTTTTPTTGDTLGVTIIVPECEDCEGGRTTTMPTTAIENENEPCKPGQYSFEQCPSTRNV